MIGRDRLAVVVVNYDSSALLADALAVPGLRAVADEVVVVDNFTSDDERRTVRVLAETHGWRLVAMDTNVGFGAGVNAGVAAADSLGCTAYLLLNPDAHVSAEVAAALFAECIEHPLRMIAPRILGANGLVWFDGATVLVDDGTTTSAPGSDSSAPGGWLTGACLMVHRDLWRRIGGFDDDYFLYWEDIDLSWRVAAAGGELAVRSDLTAVHTVGGTQPGAGKSPTYVYYNCRNRLLFAGKHLTRGQTMRWILQSPRYAWNVCTRGSGRRAIARHPGLAVAALRGTATGTFSALRSRTA